VWLMSNSGPAIAMFAGLPATVGAPIGPVRGHTRPLSSVLGGQPIPDDLHVPGALLDVRHMR
jgi:hypothetical protein